eukprot:TRINITY_DN30156_c0_g1_i1.p1 TRINITY_DN30156_c0_g1~~TRINITY_DN30156_c0_g1_i1.p1  ORF type:complete len:539 (+),score=114.23 TRINITY_DN30156_c0_g1_i1:150-1766(+)
MPRTSMLILLLLALSSWDSFAGQHVWEEEFDSACSADRSDDCKGSASPEELLQRLARLRDCSAFEVSCQEQLNASAALDQVRFSEVMAMYKSLGPERLHESSLGGPTWEDRVAAAYCKTWETIEFPETPDSLGHLRAKLANLRREDAMETLFVYADSLEDGIGARFKKGVEMIAAALRIGFDSAVLAVPPAGSLVHPPATPGWEHGPVWCHESSAEAPEVQKAEELEFPLVCWRFDFQGDFLAQSTEPEGRLLLWGRAEGSPSVLARNGKPGSSSGFDCYRLGSASKKLEGAAWRFLQHEAHRKEDLDRLFRSARAFAAPRLALPGRREALCGFGGDDNVKHVAMHIRRGDVGDSSGYALTQQLGSEILSEWLCALAATVGANASSFRLALHVYSEAAGKTLGALHRIGLPGFAFPSSTAKEKSLQTVFHTMATLEVQPSCSGSWLSQVHVVVNNNPREVLLCMARADVLVTSLSSLSWAAAVLNPGVVIHPEVKASAEQTHWDLREQYLDWAENWFKVSDIWERQESIRRAFDMAAT